MSKSLARVSQALTAAGLSPAAIIHDMKAPTRTAQEAADAAGCHLNQIVKSIIRQAVGDGERLYLFLTAGGNQIDETKASALTAAPLTRADPATIRRLTGFAIGGVSPIGHLTPVPTWADPTLLNFPIVWAAAGTPNHIFQIAPATLLNITGATVAPFTQS